MNLTTNLTLNPIKENMTEIGLNGNAILFSYKTPVACFIVGEGVYRTSKKWSATTTRHINKWITDYSKYVTVQEKPQEFFDNLLKEVV